MSSSGPGTESSQHTLAVRTSVPQGGHYYYPHFPGVILKHWYLNQEFLLQGVLFLLVGNLLLFNQSLSRVRLFATLWTAARQASLSFTIFWGSSDPGIELMSLVSPALVDGFFTPEPPGKFVS